MKVFSILLHTKGQEITAALVVVAVVVEDAVAMFLQAVVMQVTLAGRVPLVDEVAATAPTAVVAEDGVLIGTRVDRAAAETVGTRRRATGMAAG